MILIWSFCSLLWLFGTEGFKSSFTSAPSKPTVSRKGDNVTFTWGYHLSHASRSRFSRVVFGVWKNGDVATPLLTILNNGSSVFYSNGIDWLGNRSTASFKLHHVSTADDRWYGCKLDFGAFSLKDSVKLVVIASPQIKKTETHELAQVKVSEGQSIVIPCNVTGNPKPRIFWTRDGKIVQNNNRKAALTINSAEDHMTGIYTCVAENEAGIDKYDVLLLVTSCEHQSSGVAYRTQGESHSEQNRGMLHPHTTLAPTLVVAFILFVIFGAYFFFRYAGAKSKNPSRKYHKMPQDDQARSLMGEWSSFNDSGEKI